VSDVRATFLQSLDYEPDVFQVKAMNSIDADASVLVAAPTGSGKTLIAEYAIARARSLGLRAFYYSVGRTDRQKSTTMVCILCTTCSLR
jgi:ATP-dependent RNA helicase HelY